MQQPQTQSVIRLSLRWVLLAIIAMLAIGILGGMVGTSLQSPRTPLTREQNPLVTNVQEVTLSPSIAAQETIRTHERSVLLLAQGSAENPDTLGTGFVITNDGLVIGYHPPVRGDVFAIDNTGNRVSLETIGPDTIYGLQYYRIRDGVIAPLNIADTDPETGAELLAIGRSPQTLLPVAGRSTITTMSAAETEDPVAWHRLATIAVTQNTLSGTVFLNDSGALSGLYVGTLGNTNGRMLLASDIRTSLSRITSGKREVNPYERLGFSVETRFAYSEPTNKTEFQLVVSAVQPESPAAGQLRANDIITAIQNEDVTFTTNPATRLPEEGQVVLTILRAGQEQTVTIQ